MRAQHERRCTHESVSAQRLQCCRAVTQSTDFDRLQLAELLDFRPDLGVIRLHNQRVVILSAAAVGLIKKELIDTFGRDAARRLMLRFGYADGYHDAVNMRERSAWTDPIEGIRAGAVLHTLEGIARVEIVRLERDDKGRFDMEAVWHGSYTAE